MGRQDVEDKIVSIVSGHLKVSDEAVVMDALFIDDLGADSLDIVELLMALEEEFDLTISDDEASQVQTVRDLVIAFGKPSGH